MQANQAYKLGILIALLFFATAFPAHAGMTVYGLSDIYRLRLEDISFFSFLLFVCAFSLKLLWNYAFKGFNHVPRIKFFQALCLALLFGLMMLLILAMISGIREVLTPGVWRHQGTSYKLNDSTQEPARRRSLEQLRAALWDYARSHDGKFPANDFDQEIVEKLWESPDQSGSRYIYSGGRTTNDVDALLAVEPLNFGDQRFVLKISGEIESLSNKEIEQRLAEKFQP